MKTLAHGFVTVISSASIVVSSVSSTYAQNIIVDPLAPGGTFLQSGNGTPQINIAAPESGVSLNQFTDFNVGDEGLILNNATSGGLSIIGQNVTANPNLIVSGPANTIVNEVTGTSPSSMTGVTEVFGQRAAVIIANPNGIGCNGCSFLNSSSSILTTGKPVISGSQVDLLVTRGTITVGPDGFEAGQQAGLYGRHVIVDGPVTTDAQEHENTLVVSGGAQRVQALDFERLSRSQIVSAPSIEARTSPFAVDASENGTLTGGEVRVRGIEAGQGVNIYGDVDARTVSAYSAGDLFYGNVDTYYWAKFGGRDVRQYGDLTARHDVTISGDSFTLYDGRKITTGNFVSNSGEQRGIVTISADEFVVIAGEVSSAEIHVNVANGSLTNSGFLLADGELVIQALTDVSQQRDIAREYDIYFDPTLQQYLQAYYQQLIAGGPEADLAAELIERASQHEIIAEYIDQGATTTGTNVTITATDGTIRNTGGAIATTNDVRLTAGLDIINSYLSLRSLLGEEDGCSAENCGYRTDFHAGEILAGNDLTLDAGRDIRNEASNIAAANNVTLDAGRDVVNSLKYSNHEAEQNVAAQLAGTYAIRTCIEGSDSCRITGSEEREYVRPHFAFEEENILAPARIASLYGDVSVDAGRDFVSQGSEITAGNDLTIDAAEQVILTSYVDDERNFIRYQGSRTSTSCGGKRGTCRSVTEAITITEDGTVLVTAASNLVGRTVSITSGEDLTILGARILAAEDLSLDSTTGSVLIDSTDLPDTVPLANSTAVEFVELTDDLVGQIFGGHNFDSETEGLRTVYEALLEDTNVAEATATNLIESAAEVILNGIVADWQEAYNSVAPTDISNSIADVQGDDQRRAELAEQLLFIGANSLGEAAEAQEGSPVTGVDEYAVLQNLRADGASDDTLHTAALNLVDALLADLLVSTQNIEANTVAPTGLNDFSTQSQSVLVFNHIYNRLIDERPDEVTDTSIADFETVSVDAAFIEGVVFELTNETARQLGRENLFATLEDVSGALIDLESSADLQRLILELSLILSPANQEPGLEQDALRNLILSGTTDEQNLQRIEVELEEFTAELFATAVDLIGERDVQAQADAVLEQELGDLSVDVSLTSGLLSDVAISLGVQAQTEQQQRVDENTANYLAFLENNDLLTAVAALNRADSGADIKQAARDVGVQSFISLIDSDALSLLKQDVYDSLDALQNSVSLDIAAHQKKVAGLNSNVRTNLTGLTDLLEGDDAEHDTATQDALAEIDAAYSEELHTIEQAYLDDLAANEALYGDKLTTRERRTKRVRRSGGKSGGSYYTKTYYVTVPNDEYVALKNTADQHAGAERVAAIDTVTTQSELDKAYVQASYTDPDIAIQIAELSADFDASIGAFKDEKTILFNSLNSVITDITRKIELVTEQEIVEDQLRGEFIAEGTVEEGERSLASALTTQEFNELRQVGEISVNSAGGIQNTAYIQEVSTASIDFASSNLGDGIAARDKAKGTGYILYIDGSSDTRFSSTHKDNADQFVAVTYDPAKDQWYYDNNKKLVAFIPQSGDRLVARVSFSADTVELLEGVDAIIDGIPAGYINSDLNIRANRFDGESNKGEFSVNLSYLDFKEYNTVLSPDKNALLSSNREEQDKFLEATAWRFATRNGLGQLSTTPRTILLSDGDLSLKAEEDIYVVGETAIASAFDLTVDAGRRIGLLGAINTNFRLNMGNGIRQTGDFVEREVTVRVPYYVSGGKSTPTIQYETKTVTKYDWVQTGTEDYDDLAYDSFAEIGETLQLGTLARNPYFSEIPTYDPDAEDGEENIDYLNFARQTSLYDLTNTSLSAGRDLTLNSGGDILNFGGSLVSNENLILTAETDIRNEALRHNYTLTSEHDCKSRACGREGHEYKAAEILSGSGIIISAGGDVINNGSAVTAAGSLLVDAEGDIVNSALTSQFLYHYVKKSSFFGLKRKKEKLYRAVISEGVFSTEFGDIVLDAANDIHSTGSKISAGGDVVLEAANDILLEAEAEELKNYRKYRGFSGLSYGATNTKWNEFQTAFAQIEGNNIRLNAGRNATGIGALLFASQDIDVTAGEDITFDAHQNKKYLVTKGWSIGISFAGSQIVDAALKGESILDAYISTNPTLAAVDRIASGDFSVNALINLGYHLPSSGSQVNGRIVEGRRQARPISLGESLAASFNPFSGLGDNALFNGGVNADTGETASSGDYFRGISARFGMFQSRQEWTESFVSQLIAGEDLYLDAVQNVSLVGGTVASANENAYVYAGEDVLVSALADTHKSSSSSWGVTVTYKGGNSWEFGADYSVSNGSSKLYTNAALTAGRSLDVVSGRHIALTGANLVANDIYIDAGENLIVASRQNESDSESFGFSFHTSGSGSLNYANADREYVDTPTTIIAQDQLSIYTEGTTFLRGAGIWSAVGNLDINTGSLAYDNYRDHDESISVGLSGSFSTTPSGGFDAGNSDLSGTFEYRNVQALTYATIGAGDIRVRDVGGYDFSGLNRDPDSMQRVTSSTNISIEVPGINLKRWTQQVRDTVNLVEAYTTDIDRLRAEHGEGGIQLYREFVLQGLNPSELRARIGSPEFAALVRQRRQFEESVEAFGSVEAIPENVRKAIIEGYQLFLGEVVSGGDVMVVVPCLGTVSAQRCHFTLGLFEDQILSENLGTVRTALLERSGNAAGILRMLLWCAQVFPETFVQLVQQPEIAPYLELAGEHIGSGAETFFNVANVIQETDGDHSAIIDALNEVFPEGDLRELTALNTILDTVDGQVADVEHVAALLGYYGTDRWISALEEQDERALVIEYLLENPMDVTDAIQQVLNAAAAGDEFAQGQILGGGFLLLLSSATLRTALTSKGVSLDRALTLDRQLEAQRELGVGPNAPNGGAGGRFTPSQPLDASGQPIVRTNDRGGVLVQPNGSVTCGQHSCGMVLNTQGRPVAVDDIISEFPPNSPDGTSISRVSSALRSNGVNPVTLAHGRVTVDNLADFTSNGRPAIAHIRTGENRFHYVVVDGVTNRGGQRVVAIRDPAGSRTPNNGVYYETLESFSNRFTGNAIRIRE